MQEYPLSSYMHRGICLDEHEAGRIVRQSRTSARLCLYFAGKTAPLRGTVVACFWGSCQASPARPASFPFSGPGTDARVGRDGDPESCYEKSRTPIQPMAQARWLPESEPKASHER